MGLAAALLLWRSLRSFERTELILLSAAQARSTASELQKGMQIRVDAFVRIGRAHWRALRDGQPWEVQIIGLESTLWVEPSGIVARAAPAEGPDLAGADLTAREDDRRALLEAGRSGQPLATRSIPQPAAGAAFHVVVPISGDGRLQGFVVGVFSGEALFPVVLPPGAAPDWATVVVDGDRELYRRGSPMGGRWLAESPVTVLGTVRRVRAGPRPELLAHLRSFLPGVVLATGGVIALLLAASVGLAQSARRRARSAEEAEATVRASEARFRDVLDAALDAVVMMDSGGRVVSWNRRAETIFGFTRAEALGRRLAELIIPHRYREAHARGLERFLATGEGPVIDRRIELSALRRDGSEFPVELTVAALEQSGALLFSAFVADITERRRAEQDLRAAQERLAHVVASSPAVLYSLKVEGGTLATPAWVSENVERLLGYSVEEVLDPGWWAARVHPEDQPRVLREEAILLTEGYVTHEYRFRHKQGGYRWLRAELRLLRDAAGRPVEAVGSWSDITARKEAELRLQESEEQYRLLFDSNPHPMWVYDDETLAFLAVNDAAVRHYGYSREEFSAMTLRDIRPPSDVPVLEEQVARRREAAREPFSSPRVWRHRKKDAAVIDVEISSSPITFRGRPGWLALAADVTEKKRLEAQLLQAQKMESVGRLAGGVAHDFNNLLGVITGYGDLLQREIGPEHPGFHRVEEIRKAAERAAVLTRQLLAFSRKQVLEPTVLDLNVVVSDTENMLRRLIGEDVQLVTVLAGGLGRVKGDRGQLEQVIVNMAVNARDAMPQGGKLIIETADVDLDEKYARTRSDASPGPHVMLAVSDTGHGMDAETRSHLFEPFFTTKGPGRGTGLGLATVYGIVRQSGGHVMVYSEPGQGTTFKVYLPRFEGMARPAEASATAEGAPSGVETILLVEDEASLRVLILEILESAGYRVLEGPTPEEALTLAGAHAEPIHLVLTDVVLPRMSGRQMAESLQSSRPDTRVLFMSGYTDDAISHHGILETGVHFLQKPFTTDALLRKVRDVLDAPVGVGPS